MGQTCLACHFPYQRAQDLSNINIYLNMGTHYEIEFKKKTNPDSFKGMIKTKPRKT